MSATMYRAVVWKELREHLKWAVGVLPGMAAVLAYAIPSLRQLLRDGDLHGISRSLEAITTVGGLLAGLLFGAAQTLAENRGDKWGFLTHRPIGRTTLFWGKSTAGILLYAISTGLPVAVALLWIASPGYLPIPFDWRIALPAIANLLGGLVFYFAGLLTGMREARWYVSRPLGIGAAFCFLFLQNAVAATFLQAIAASAAGLLIVGTAAWSTFIAGGQYGVQPRIGRIATGVSIGLGITLVGWIVFALNVGRFEVAAAPPEPRYTRYAIDTEGVLVRVTNLSGRIVEVSDPDGRPLEQYRNFVQHQIPRDGVLSATLSRGPQATPSFRSFDRLFSQLRRANPGDPISWYYVHRSGLLAAYDTQSRKLIGWMGPDGFSRGEAKPRAFAGRLKNPDPLSGESSLLVFEDAVYRVDLDKRRVENVFQHEPAEALLDARSVRFNAATLAMLGDMAEFDVIWTTRRVIVQLRDGTRLLEATQDSRDPGIHDLQVTRALRAPGVPTFLWFLRGLGEESHVSEFNSAGAVVNSWTLPSFSRASSNRVTEQSRLGIAISSTIIPPIAQASFRIVDREQRRDPSSSRPARTTYWAVAILSSLISAAAVFLRGRRYAFPPGRLSSWTGIALLLGPLGYLLMLALIEWPARESCPACSRKRVVTRERCEHCGQPFAASPKDGTEIFELEPARPH